MHRIHHSITAVGLMCTVLIFTPSRLPAQTYVFGTASYAAPSITSSSPTLGNAPIITADFNGDGIPDLAILGSVSGTQGVSIFLGRPDSTFAPRVDYAVQASGIAVGDFNGDGKLDIVTVSSTYYPIATILIGNGDGTFQPPASVNLGIPNGEYSAVSSADFNGDGKMDLVLLTPNYGTGATMAVLLGKGDGTFEAPVTYQVPVAPYLAIADFNGDGMPDIAIAGPNYSSGQPNLLVVLINNGNGTFQNPVKYSLSGLIESLAVADLNQDGKLDLIVPTGGQTAAVNVMLGMGDGTFASPVTYTNALLSVNSGSVAVADFNGDGKPDIAITPTNVTALSGNGVALLLGNGDGTFQNPPLIYGAGLDPTAVIAWDVNRDGKPDLVVYGGYSPGTSVPSFCFVTVLVNQGEGNFSNLSTYPLPQYPYSAVAGDFNGDGKPDIAADSFNSSGSVSVLLGKGDGTFQPHIDTAVGTYPTVLAAGDFNGDGVLDLVVAGTTGASTAGFFILLGNGDGTFLNPLTQTTSSIVRSLAVGDFNRDGKLDVAAVLDGTSAVSIFLGTGNGTFAAPVQYATGAMLDSPPYHNVLAGDFNQDGILDLAVSTDAGVSILLGKGDGTFQPYSATLPGEALIALGDFNGDGKLDLALAGESSVVTLALGNGNGTFQQAASFPLAGILNVQSSVVGDFDGDGKLDLAFAAQSSNVVTILFGNGDGTFNRQIEYAAGSVSNNVYFMVASDFNGDGALDLALASFSDGNMDVFLSSPVVSFYPSPLIFAIQPFGTSSGEQPVSISNPSPVPILFSGIGTTGEFAETNTCGSSLSPGAACQAEVTFTPTAEGPVAGTLFFDDDALGGSQILRIAGTGGGPVVQLSSSSLTFSSQLVGSTSSAQAVTLNNTGSATLALTDIVAGGDFSETNTCGSNVAARSSCTVSVRFMPTVEGSRTGTLTITDDNNGVAGSTQTVSLSGTGTGPVVSLSAPSETFTSQLVGTTSSAQVVTLNNSGNAALTIGSIAASGDFAATTACGASVAAGANCNISITFTPSAGGSRTGTLSVSDNAPGSPQTVSLVGAGQDFALSMASGTSSTSTVAPGQTATYQLSLSGLGGLSQVINLTCTGAPSEATCSLNPSSVTLSASGATSVAVSVSTTGASAVAPLLPRTPPPFTPGPAWKLFAVLLLGLLIFGSPQFGRQIWRRTNRVRLVLVGSALMALALAMPGCGGGGGGGGGSQNPGTPAGTYPMTVTATCSGLQHSIKLTLTVN